MNTIVFSDTHLNKNFDNSRYEILTKIIKQADRIIINGDFWEGYLISAQEFINSQWNKLFPLLKSKNTIYIFGNHDTENQNSSKFTEQFCTQALNFIDIEPNNVKFHIEHGHRFFRNLSSIFPNIQQTIANLYYGTGTHLLKEIFGKQYLHQNHKLNKILTTQYPSYKIITSHTHLPININNKFFNTGMINYGLVQYLKIDNAKIELINERY